MRESSSDSGASSLVCLGLIMGAHGTGGRVTIRSFTENVLDIAAHGALRDEQGRSFAITDAVESSGNRVIATLRGVGDRETAMSLRGVRLYVSRAVLPALEEESWYYTDLIGLAAHSESGDLLGAVHWVHDFGGGEDLLEIAPSDGGASFFVPFTRAHVPVVDMKGGRIVIVPLEMAETDMVTEANAVTDSATDRSA